ncbi:MULTISPECIES: contact-dependent inhibition immunity protein BcpI [Burkholderia]|nr:MULTISPECIES: contact-dependent inhibition immunity protein BcpI [Burkholderia]MCA8352437.1 contact-dependent inhibition immunity protein BcpI [Burkholderia cepacia]MCE4127877.1 contact-dependent inhibition immunity protein BcpI [Burkholderia cepacia]MDN7896916.1 contact-dependent inhibition immunity protein BcpI [Burkholderia cepacia]QFS40921.1 Immunity protein 49 [Burkholderia cepacia]
MTNRTALDKLANFVQIERNGIPELVHDAIYRRNKVRLGIVYNALASRARAQAVFDYFSDRNIAASKQNFYLSSKLSIASCDLDGGASFTTGLEMLCAILSDNESVIEAAARMETSTLLNGRNDPKSAAAFQYRFQLAILGKDQELGARIEEVKKNGTKADRQAISNGEYFFSLLLARDAAGLRALIEKRHANVKCVWPDLENFISYLGTLETKICWRRGIQIEIDHPLVPMELMPVKPLDHYDDVYDFLKPGWVPPPQGLIGRVSRWFKT